ncbi:MAG TPA: hypothetical protein VJS90_03425, partial [Pseudomonas sp.]|uniref:hypothetical protein n=1 Tax=Pseudomonas sp. TaxID=306 RepID=UPI002B480B4D
MFSKLPIVFIALAGCSAAFAHQHTHSDAGGAYAIENPLRPGAKAPYCQTQDETADGCTFHSVAGETYSAHLLAGEGETWIAATPDTQTINFETQPKPSVLEGKSYQVIKVVPNPA